MPRSLAGPSGPLDRPSRTRAPASAQAWGRRGEPGEGLDPRDVAEGRPVPSALA